MKITNYCSMLIALMVITTSFPSCDGGEGEPIPNREEQNDGNDNKDDGKDNPGIVTESPYKPCFTANKVKELVIEEIKRDPNIPSRTESYYYHNIFSYDNSGRICEHKRFTENSNNIQTENITYVGDTIKRTYPDERGLDSFLLLNSEGYISDANGSISSRKYDKSGYLVGYYLAGYNDGNCTLNYENGNLVRESAPINTYVCSYTEHLNNTSLDLSYFLVRREGSTLISVPTDIEGKRSKNLPAKWEYVRGTIWTTYSYEFDSDNRVVQITSKHESDFSDYPTMTIYYVTYMD